jgi:methyl-accepting chemotaxis protein
MLKNMKLGLKMSLGFGLVILLVVIVGGLAVFNMLQIQEQSTALEREYIPEVDVANNIERNAQQLMYNMRGYSLKFDEDFYEQGQRYMKELNSYLEDAQNLAASSDILVQLQKDVKTAREYVSEYKSLANETAEVIDEIRAQREVLDESAALYMKQAHAFLETQREFFMQDLENDVGDEKIAERLRKVNIMNDAIDYANNARILTFKAQADFNYSMIKDAIAELDKIPALAEEINAITRKQVNLEQLQTIGETRQRYYTALQKTQAAYERLEQLNQKRDQAADNVLEAAQNTAMAGIDNTKQISAEAVNTISASVTMIGIGLGIALLLSVIIALILTTSIVRALQKGVGFAENISRGDLHAELDVYQKDEIGVLAEALRGMQKSIQYKAEKIEQIAHKDLSVEIQKASEQDGLGDSLILMKNSLNELLGQVNNAVEQVSSGADQVSQASQNLSQGATEQASSLEEITSSTNEVNSQSKQNAENAQQAQSIAKQATEDAEAGNEQMKQLSQVMEKINASSDEINKVVKVIDDISFQINLLALNANVEAARAGKYGKGFAVVADEVRNLAVKSADSVKETTQMVEETVTNIKEGTEATESTAKQLASIVEGSGKVANFLDEIAQASREQAQAIDQITEGLDQIDQATQSSTASAEESASASEELAGQAQQLHRMVADFKLDKRYSGGNSQQLLTQGTHLQNLSGSQAQGGQAEKQNQASRTQQQNVGRGGSVSAERGGMSASESQGRQKGSGKQETGITPVKAEEQISLDDDDYERF